MGTFKQGVNGTGTKSPSKEPSSPTKTPNHKKNKQSSNDILNTKDLDTKE